MENFKKYWKLTEHQYENLLQSYKQLNTTLKQIPKHSAISAVMWNGELTDWVKVNEQLIKYYPDNNGKVGSNIPNYNPVTQYLVFTSKGWTVADKPSFDEEE